MGIVGAIETAARALGVSGPTWTAEYICDHARIYHVGGDLGSKTHQGGTVNGFPCAHPTLLSDFALPSPPRLLSCTFRA